MSRPVLELKSAQDGLLLMVKVKVSPSGSDALGVNEYCWPMRAAFGGVPEIVGAELPTGPPGGAACWTVSPPDSRQPLSSCSENSVTIHRARLARFFIFDPCHFWLN